jgi:AraC family transcriptional regulator
MGMHLHMSLSSHRTAELWRSFMPRRKEIVHTAGPDLFSIQIYPPGYAFEPDLEFVKWAGVEVIANTPLPAEMDVLIIPPGLYAVFPHKGGPAKGAEVFHYIFGSWLPSSHYEFDNRPQFEVLGEKYKGDAPDSEEEIWVPVRQRT